MVLPAFPLFWAIVLCLPSHFCSKAVCGIVSDCERLDACQLSHSMSSKQQLELMLTKKYTLSLQRKLVYLASLLLYWLTPEYLFPELLAVEVIYWIDYPRSPGHQDRQCRMCLYVCLVFPTSGSSSLATKSEILDSIRPVIRKAALMCS